MTDLIVDSSGTAVSVPLSEQFSRAMQGWLSSMELPPQVSAFLGVVVQMYETNAKGLSDDAFRTALANGLSIISDFRSIMELILEGIDDTDPTASLE